MKFVKRGNRHRKQILIIGSGSDLNSVYLALSKNKRNFINVVCMDTSMNDKISSFINSADEVYICSSLSYNLKEQIINLCIGIKKTVFIIPRIYEISIARAKVHNVEDILLLKMDNVCISRNKELIKRIVDIVISIIGIIVTLPLMLFIAAAIKFCDGRSILFCQERLTKGGILFTLYKFRTMVADAEKHTGPVLTGENDKRITPVGRVLRVTRADELPQLFNVLKGDMSMVGPRPERPHFSERFSKSIPEFQYRLAVKAGITGLAQVLGKYSTTPENKLRFDLLYIKNYSVWLDIYILFRTIGVLFKKDYSAGVAISAETDNALNEFGASVNTL